MLVAAAAAVPAAAETWAERCATEWTEGVATSCEEAVAENVRDLESWNNLAQGYIVRGDDKLALKTLENITVLTPDDPVAHFNYGATAGTLRRYDIAVDALRRALALKPDYLDANLVLSIALDKLGRFDEAVEVKRSAAALGDDTVMFELAEGYVGGVSTTVSEGEARAWVERAANLGHIGAMDWMVDIYREGQLGETPDPVKAEHWRRRARDARENCC